jgi:oxygen-dependent protoporphyrinogen oxidase
MRVVVVGGGISGLAAAHRFHERAPHVEVVVLEASERVGGLIHTECAEGYVIERGAESIITDKPWAMDLARRVGLSSEIVSTVPERRGAYVVARRRLERIPEGFSLLAPMHMRPFLESPIMTWRGKARAALDLVLPRGDVEDESLAAFVERRFGRELLDRLAQPLVSGIYGAPADKLSLEATMPRFVEMEREARSVTLGLRRRQRAAGGQEASGARYGLFISFRKGNQMLVDAVAQILGERVRCGVEVRGLTRRAERWCVETSTGREEADAVVLALPAHRAAALVGESDKGVAASLGAIPYGSAATVTFAFRREQIAHPLDAYGFVVPAIEQKAVLASTWLSRKWPGRAPSGMELVRVFLGGSGRPEAPTWDDGRLVAAAMDELAELMGVKGDPALTRIDRYIDAMPHYYVGHRARIARLRERASALVGLHFVGNAYEGVGIPDSVRVGEGAADAIVDGA